MLLIVDLDGSIADWKPRNQAAGGDPGRENIEAYKAYVERLMADAALSKDEPVKGMQTVIRALANREGVELLYLTGRSEKHRRTTEQWLMRHRFPEAKLLMRELEDWRSAAHYKLDVLASLRSKYDTIVAIEDESEVVEAFAERGVTVLQVRYGGRNEAH